MGNFHSSVYMYQCIVSSLWIFGQGSIHKISDCIQFGMKTFISIKFNVNVKQNAFLTYTHTLTTVAFLILSKGLPNILHKSSSIFQDPSNFCLSTSWTIADNEWPRNVVHVEVIS